MLAGKFTARRMRQLTARVEQITADHLDAIERTGPPVDLVSTFARPVPTVMICELLGVPYADRGASQPNVESFMDGETSDDDLSAAYTATQVHLADLVAAKRAHPTDDVLSDLTGSHLTDDELQGISLVLLAAGFDTTANMLALGTFALLRHPAQLAGLRADPALVDTSVEELLRYRSVAKTFMRTALEDVELGGRTIEAGTAVMLSFHRQPRSRAFRRPRPARPAQTRSRAPGLRPRQPPVPGGAAGRVELRVAFPALIHRLPTLRLAVPADQVELRPETADIYGVKSLPITWDA